MSTEIALKKDDWIEVAKELPTDCDFFQELSDLYIPLAETETEKFRQRWVEQYENGEIELVKEMHAYDDTEYMGDENGWNMAVPSCVDDALQQEIDKLYSEVFPRCAMIPITDIHRDFMVTCYARDMTTEEALSMMVHDFPGFEFLQKHVTDIHTAAFWDPNEICNDGGEAYWVIQKWKKAFSYLRPSHSRFPKDKYGAVWREAKDAFDRARIEQFAGTENTIIAGLAEAMQKVQIGVSTAKTDSDINQQVKTLIAVSTALHKILRDRNES